MIVTMSPTRADHPVDLTWNLTDIYPDWAAWDAARHEWDARIDEYAAIRGTLVQGPHRLLTAMRLSDALGQLAYKVYFFASLKYDEDQRDNDVNARRQQVAGAAGAVAAGHLVVQPGAAGDSARDRSRVARG